MTNTWLFPGDPGYDKALKLGFCPTGKGGGIDNSCGAGGEGGGVAQTHKEFVKEVKDIKKALPKGVFKEASKGSSTLIAPIGSISKSQISRTRVKLMTEKGFKPTFEGMKGSTWTEILEHPHGHRWENYTGNLDSQDPDQKWGAKIFFNPPK
jgi:hypothetical protein